MARRPSYGVGPIAPMSPDVPLSTRWQLAPAVHGVAVGDDLVFLNVASDGYFCLPGATALATLAPNRRDLQVADTHLASDLATAGLVLPTTTNAVGECKPMPPRPRSSALADLSQRPRWCDLPEAFRCLVDLFLNYRGKNLEAIVLTVSRTPSWDHFQPPTKALLDEVERFNCWIPYAPVSGKCLLQSFLLLRLLRRRGHDAAWVFGVTTWPFRAHCWLQVGDVVLNDTYERLWLYQPIMVV